MHFRMIAHMAAATALAASAVPARAQQCSDAAIDPAKVLLISAPAVVADQRAEPGGPWHFSSLIKRLLPAGASAKDQSAFVLAWLNTWNGEQQLSPDATKPAGGDNPL